MGLNSCILITNDCLHEIANDPEFGRKVDQAIQCNQKEIGHGSKLISCHHNSSVSVLLIGGNVGHLLGYAHEECNDGSEESKVRILKKVAKSMGYDLRKRPR